MAPHLFWRSLVAVLSVLAVAGGLVFFGLSNNAFWDDEANTALFGRNLLHTGKLTAFDGTNVIGFRQGAELDSHLVNVYMPPVQYYLAASGLKLFGATTFGGRFPFVIAGLMSIGVLALFTRWHLGNWIPLWLPPLLVAVNPAYLMFVRQCRYYSVVALVTMIILATWSHNKTRGHAQIVAGLVAASAACVLMFTNYLDAVALAAVLPVFFMSRRYRTRANLQLLGTVYLALILAGAYVLTTANPLIVNVSYKNTITGLHRIALLLWWHISGLPRFEFLPIATPVLLLVLLLFNRNGTVASLVRESFLLCVVMLVYSIVIVAFSPQTVTGNTQLADMRYVVTLMPIGAVASAAALAASWYMPYALGPILAVVTCSLMLGTNLFTSACGNWQPIRSTLYEYLVENAHDYTTGNESIIDFLKKLPKSYVIRVIPDYMTYPAMFYVPNQHYCCQLGDGYQYNAKLGAPLPDYVYF